jgi:hypothetical protein
MEIKNPTWPKVLYGISMFSAQYYISGLLDYTMINSTLINAILAIAAIVGYIFFDGSTAGFLLACATATGGPLAEIFLINIPHLYQYTHADFMGICTWIPWVYFLGMYVCMYVYIYLHIYMYIYIYVYVYMNMYINIHVYE